MAQVDLTKVCLSQGDRERKMQQVKKSLGCIASLAPT